MPLVLCTLNEFIKLSYLLETFSMIKSIFIIILNIYFLFENNLQASESVLIAIVNYINLIKNSIFLIS